MNKIDLPKRKANRLANYDYSQNGAYFITICVKDKEPILSRISKTDLINPAKIKLSKIGIIIKDAIIKIPEHYNGVFVDNHIIMPNHIQLIIRIQNDSGRIISVPTIIGSMKRYVSKKVGTSIWQKSFYDHIIRDEADYLTKWKYIDDNPEKWEKDELYTENP